MIKSEIVKDMKSFMKGASFITRLDLARYMGYGSPKSVDRYIRGLEKVGGAYFIPEVAENIQKYKKVKQ